MPLLPDLSPLREHADYRRLYLGFTLSGIGAQMAVVAIGLQAYALTGSTAAVGLVGLFALVPLIVMGLYGGALLDHHDRRTIGLVAHGVTWLTSLAAVAQSAAGNTRVWVLYLLVAVWSGASAVTSPARTSIYPRILPRAKLPAANALSVFAMNTALTVGPLLAGVLVDWRGFTAAYLVDAVITAAGLWRLHPIPPEAESSETIDTASDGEAPRPRAGLRSVWDGLAFLTGRPNVRMTFVADIVAMVLAQPRVLMPAVGAVYLGGGARTVGALYAAVAIGGLIAMLASGPLGHVRRQGLAIMVCIAGWGFGIAGLGVALLAADGPLTRSQAFWVAAVSLGFAGGCDAVSAVFRTTILQAAAPDRLRGRLQGLFIVVVAGGPRLGEIAGGGLAERIGEDRMALIGGLACVVVIGTLCLAQPGFLRYDARHPTP